MNGIIGFLESLSNTKLDNTQTDYINEIRYASSMLLDQVNDILDFEKIESNNLKLENIKFNITQLLNSSINMFKPKITRNEPTLQLVVDNLIPQTVMGDPKRLRQVISNLLSNAIKFTHNGNITLKAHLVAIDGNEITINFEVKDTGIGIKKDYLNKIFESYSQADESISRKFGGTGLGLSITKKLVELMSGTISVDSEIDKGTSFLFDIKFKKTKSEDKVENVVNEDNLIKDILKKYKILIVEDNQINVHLLFSLLAKYDVKPDIANNGFDAVKQFIKNNHDIIFLDCNIPILNGYKVSKCIRKFENSKAGALIIGMTADVSKSTYDRCIEAGMDDFLSKPIDGKIIFSKLKEVLVNSKKINP
jgi:CheY-like chemotaxis protein/anti-sigma regulatory factor (Ser/Thr protein kinase)